MAVINKKAPVRKRGKGGKIALWIIAFIVIAFSAVMGWAALNANTVHVRHANVVLDDLPGSFDGCKVLFVSDIDLCGINSPDKSAELFERLQELKPDILLLGGDYASTSIMEILNQTAGNGRTVRDRSIFFRGIRNFEAPMGKFAVAGDNDEDIQGLSHLMTEAGIQPLFNDHAAVSLRGDTLHIVGFNSDTSGVNFNSVAGAFRNEDCVIALTHSPALFPKMLTAEAKNNGEWADLILGGHTHGGQIRLLGRNVIRLSSQEQGFLKGWKKQGGSLMLTSTGTGCEGANLRLGSQAEVWLITLQKNSGGLPDLL